MKLGFGPIRVCTTAGQPGTPPGPKVLQEQSCDPGVRELIGSLLFLSRCIRFDISFVIARKVCHTLVRTMGSKGYQTHSRFCRALSGVVSHHEKRRRRLGGAETQHLLRCVVLHEMFRRIQSRGDGVKRQFMLDRLGKSPTSRRARVHLNQNQSSGDEQPKQCCELEEHWTLVA